MEQRNEKPHTFLTLQSKLEIIECANNGEGIQSLSKQYGVCSKTIRRIIKQKEKLENRKSVYHPHQGGIKKKRFTGVEETKLEKILVSWFFQQRDVGIAVSGSMLQRQALYLNRVLGGPSSFKASNGWLYKFQQRHCMREQREQCEKDASIFAEFITDLHNLIEEKRIAIDNLYNCDETGLMWKYISRKHFAPSDEASTGGNTLVKEMITIMACANATGTHKVPLLVVGRSKQPSCFKNVKSLPSFYTNQENGCMDKAVFIDWFKNIFVRYVEAKNQEKKENIMLILDKDDSHPPVEEIHELYPQCTVICIPPNVMSTSQPMNQGVIEGLKQSYKKNICVKLLVNKETQSKSPRQLLESWTLLDCIKTLQTSWESISKQIVCNAWKKILKEEPLSEPNNASEEITELSNKLLAESFTKEDLSNWLDIGEYDAECENNTLDEMAHAEQIKVELIDNSGGEEDMEECSDPSVSIPQMHTPCEVYKSLNGIYDWLIQRGDTDPDLLRALDKLQDNVANIALSE